MGNRRNAKKIIACVRRGFASPTLIVPFLKGRIRRLFFYCGNGSRAGAPNEVKLYVNSVCNANCVMCDIGAGNTQSTFYKNVIPQPGAVLSAKSCERLADEFAVFRPCVDLCGTEPLLHPDILALVSAFKKKGLKVNLTTNGILLEGLAPELVALGVDSVKVSLDGPEAVHNAIRGKGIYQKAIAGVRALLRCRAAAGSAFPAVSAVFCVNHLNFGCLAEFAQIALEEGLDSVHFLHPYFVTEAMCAAHNERFFGFAEATPVNVCAFDPAKIDTDVLWEQLQIIKNSYNNADISFNIDMDSKALLERYYRNPLEPIGEKMCFIPWIQATIAANGDVLINNRCVAQKLGNICENAFMDVWNGENYRRFRSEFKKTGLFPVCFRCCGTVTQRLRPLLRDNPH